MKECRSVRASWKTPEHIIFNRRDPNRAKSLCQAKALLYPVAKRPFPGAHRGESPPTAVKSFGVKRGQYGKSYWYRPWHDEQLCRSTGWLQTEGSRKCGRGTNNPIDRGF